MKSGSEGTCGGGSWRKRYAGNSHRKQNDDGTRKSRKPAGPRSHKHTSRMAR